jgi:leucyl aminopeptidase
MKINVRSASPTAADADLVVLGVFSSTAKKGPSSPALDALDKALGGALVAQLKAEEFTGKREQCLLLPTFGKTNAKKIAIVGLGAKENNESEPRTYAARAARLANAERATTVAVVVPDGWESRMRALAEGLELGAYRFTKYLTGDRAPKKHLEDATILTTRKVPGSAKKDIDLGQRIAHGVNVARDLSNEPPNNLFPEDLAAAAKKEGKKHDFSVKVFDHESIQKHGMWLIHAVGRGSSHGPRLVHMSYSPKKKAKKKVCFVGKGITFDTGGISIKPAQGMEWMKHDMSGAANMVGLMIAVAESRPNVEVHALMACAENMPDGNAYRPGDIWGSYDGKTVEIVNTDAEGRLVLADALAYAAKDIKPDFLVDNATLTGAVVVALGNTTSAFYASNEDTAARFWSAVRASGEPVWRMPLLQDLRDQIRSDVADVKHVGDRWGGSIVGALFLREFIGEIENWVHVDIAGPAATDKSWSWHGKGATGHGVLTFLALVDKLAGK